MSVQLKRGLAEFGYPDHYAVLGLSVDSSAGEIRKRYVKLARMLHPDSCAGINKDQASQLLSKLVNPAYQVLSQDKERADYSLLLKLVGQRANLEFDVVKSRDQLIKKLLGIEDYELFYQSTLQELSDCQYEQLDQSIEHIEQLSELNLAFLLRRERAQGTSSQAKYPEPSRTVSAEPISPEVSVTVKVRQPAAFIPSDDYVSKYLRRAETLMAKNLYQAAAQELKDALKRDPKNVRCQVLMATIYLKQKQPKMAKGHLTQALKLDPQNAEALQEMIELRKQEAEAAKTAQAGSKTTQPGSKAAPAGVKPSGRGLFGLFGGKK